MSFGGVRAAILAFLVAATARADDKEEPPAPRRFDAAIRSADAGAFQPFTAAARIEGRATMSILSGYDSAYGSAAMSLGAEVRIWGPIAIRGGAVWVPEGRTIAPTAGVRVQVLSQERFGIDLSLGAQYKPEGLTEATGEGELEGVVAVGRRFGKLGLVGNAVFGSDFEGNDRDGEVRLASMYSFSERWRAGLDSRARFDLGSVDVAAGRKAKVDVVAGPTASFLVGPVALVGTVGYSGVQLFGANNFSSGVIAMGGVGAAF